MARQSNEGSVMMPQESPRENIANALTILEGTFVVGGDDTALGVIRARLRRALEQLGDGRRPCLGHSSPIACRMYVPAIPQSDGDCRQLALNSLLTRD